VCRTAAVGGLLLCDVDSANPAADAPRFGALTSASGAASFASGHATFVPMFVQRRPQGRNDAGASGFAPSLPSSVRTRVHSPIVAGAAATVAPGGFHPSTAFWAAPAQQLSTSGMATYTARRPLSGSTQRGVYAPPRSMQLHTQSGGSAQCSAPTRSTATLWSGDDASVAPQRGAGEATAAQGGLPRSPHADSHALQRALNCLHAARMFARAGVTEARGRIQQAGSAAAGQRSIGALTSLRDALEAAAKATTSAGVGAGAGAGAGANFDARIALDGRCGSVDDMTMRSTVSGDESTTRTWYASSISFASTGTRHAKADDSLRVPL
jgi:hypothetical protein